MISFEQAPRLELGCALALIGLGIALGFAATYLAWLVLR